QRHTTISVACTDSVLYYIVHLSDTLFSFFFFFQAEDGIRDRNVTGVQTCALPILITEGVVTEGRAPLMLTGKDADAQERRGRQRSEERRVGKECRSRWAPYQ